MKKTLKLLSMLMAALLIFSVMPLAVLSASAETTGDYNYTVLADGTVEITDYCSNETNVEVPSAVDGMAVISIAPNAFKNCSNLKAVTIPPTITNIDKEAFDSQTVVYGNPGSVAFSYVPNNFVCLNPIAGDINCDINVNSKDTLQLKRYVASMGVAIVAESADVNYDGNINSKDSLLLKKYLADWDVQITQPDYPDNVACNVFENWSSNRELEKLESGTFCFDTREDYQQFCSDYQITNLSMPINQVDINAEQTYNDYVVIMSFTIGSVYFDCSAPEVTIDNGEISVSISYPGMVGPVVIARGVIVFVPKDIAQQYSINNSSNVSFNFVSSFTYNY